MKHFLTFLLVSILAATSAAFGQDSTAFQWQVSSKKIQNKVYELTFTASENKKWQIYGPNEVISEVPAAELEFADSSIQIAKPFKE